MIEYEPIQCRLPASGFTYTPDEVYIWAKRVVAAIRAALPSGTPPNVLMWAYREQRREWLSLIFHDTQERDYCLTFLIGDPHDFHMTELTVPDMTEALHMAGILIADLDAVVSIGRRWNEVNRTCTPDAWVDGQTSGVLKLV